MRRAVAVLAGTLLLFAACGVKGPPRPPRREASRPAEPPPPPIFAADAGCPGPCPEVP